MNRHKPWRIVHSEASLGWGGQEHRVLAELTGFQRRGAWVALLAPRESVIHRRAGEAGIQVKHLDVKKARYPINALRLKRWLKENQVQIVNTHSSRDGYLVGAAARLAACPMLIRSRHIDVTYPNQWISRHAFASLADHVITTSQKITNRLRETFNLPEDRVTAIPTGIDLQTFQAEGAKADLFPDDPAPRAPILGMVSVLRSWKGHPIFLEAARLLLDRGIAARFAIVGEGPQRANIEARIAELHLEKAVILPGHREDVPAVLRSLDALAIPSTGHEGVPQIGLQALAVKTPVVGSDAGGIPEIIRHGETGRVVPANQPEALADALEATLRDRETTQRCRDQGRRLVEREHSLDHMLDQLEAVYARAA